MPRKRRQGKIPTPAWERHDYGTLGRQVLTRSPQFYATIGIVLLVVVAIGIVGYSFLADYQATKNRPNSTALQIDDTKFTLKYYTARLKLLVQQAGGPGAVQPSAVIFQLASEQLVQEQISLRFAGEQGQSASDDDVNAEIATRLGIKTDAPEFQDRAQEELTRTGLTEPEYREMIKAALLRRKMLDKLTAEVPASAESIRFRQIQVADQGEADDLKRKIETGADFAALAQEKSLETSTKATGGDVGWVPRGVLNKELEDYLFGLDQGKVSTYSAPDGSSAYVYQVTEKSADRPIDDNVKPELAQKKLQDWMNEKRGGLKIEDLVINDTDKAQYAVDRAFATA